MTDIAIVPEKFDLKPDQEQALGLMLDWYNSSPDHFFVLEAPAGYGKTYTAKAFASRIKGRIAYVAPTNKATKVLRQMLKTKSYTPECRTIYSLLGLRMEANGEVKELAKPEEAIDLTQYALIICDEAGMNNSQLMGYIRQAAETFNLKFLFMGDSKQLPPVGEKLSEVWKLDCPRATLTIPKRNDSQIFALTNLVRSKIGMAAPSIRFTSDNDENQGVWVVNQKQFEAFIHDEALIGGFHDGTAKVISWRNATVDKWNRYIRLCLYGQKGPDGNFGAIAPWYVGERVIFTAPAKDLDDEIKATTDDEGIVQSVVEDWHPIYGEFKTFRITVILEDSTMVIARVLHPESQGAWNRKSEQLAAEAKADKRRWKQFWEFKDMFHSLRHAYAITAHRSQGSTYERAYVEYKDILVNQDRNEAFCCLHVAVSRPRSELYLA